MAELIVHRKVLIDGEFHITDEICWCKARHDKYNDTVWHKLKLDEGTTYVRGYPNA